MQKRFKVTSIPSLIILDAKDGSLVRNDGRYMVLKDPEGTNFPWFQKSVQEILVQGPLSKNGSMCLASDALTNKLFGILFSAQWCPPCREFTKRLKETTEHLKKKGIQWEIVFCSADRNIESFRDHVSTLPTDWYVIPFGDERKDSLCRFFNVTGIPSFILIDENMEAIRTNGRLCVTIDPTGENFPWRPRQVEDINDITAQSINDTVSLIIFTEGIESHVKSAKENLQIIAEEFEEKRKKSKRENEYMPDIVFLFEEKPSEVVESIKSYAELEDRVPLIVLLDVPSQQIYIDENSIISVHLLRRLIDDYCSGRLIMSEIPD
ncbi:DgyrCDS9832 [Dimorphilus gyrociliatus]|nr:DgyrCDS9832 [Dimorphilus gyrociliatus]